MQDVAKLAGVATVTVSRVINKSGPVRPGPLSQQQAYHEVGSLETLRGKDKLFAVERRGGYPWSEGYFNHNMYAPLPTQLANDGRETILQVGVCDPLATTTELLRQVTVRVVLFGARAGDRLAIKLNGTPLGEPAIDPQWKDPQIFSPKPQPASGGTGEYKIDPEQKLMLLVYEASPTLFHIGQNQISLRLSERLPYRIGENIVVEKVEVDVDYE